MTVGGVGGSGMELSRMNFSFHLQHNLYNIQLEEIEFRAFFLLRLRIPLGFQRDAGKKVRETLSSDDVTVNSERK